MSRLDGIDLACRRGGRIVFAGLDFAIEPGRALLLTGPNGSGKSSLLRLMAGLVRPFAGRLDWDSAPVADDPEAHRQRVGYLGHLDALKPALTVAETVGFWAGLAGHADRTMPAIASFGMGDLADLPVRLLSAGQRRRVALARIAAAGAPLWLLDEPTVGLDAASLAALETVLARHLAEGGMAAIATHAPIALAAERLDLARFASVPEPA